MYIKKGKKIAIGVVMIILAIIYFGVKAFLLWTLPNPQSFMNKSGAIEAFDKKDTITIKKTIPIEDDYFYYDGLKFRNDFEIFDEEHNVYTIKNTDIRVVFDKHPIDYLVAYVKEEVKNMGMYYDLTKDLEKNDINTDYELYEYLYANLNPKLSLFSSINKFRKAHAIDLAAMIVTVGFNKFTLINGDYEGYILRMNGAKEAIINHNNYRYHIRIYSNEYPDEKLYDLLSIISFDDNKNDTDSRDLYAIAESMGRKIYSDEKNPMFMENGVKTSIKEFLPKSNCTYSCIHNYSNPIEKLYDGGTEVYAYEVESETYYFILCNKMNSKYNNGKDILIGKNKEKLINLC